MRKIRLRWSQDRHLGGIVLRSLGKWRGQLVPELLPLLPVLVDHPDVVVDVRPGLPVVNVGRIVRPLRGVTPVANVINLFTVVSHKCS